MSDSLERAAVKVDYTALSLTEVRTALGDIAREAETVFGQLVSRQLNWRPDETRWSVAQCFDHLVMANRLMLAAGEEAMDVKRPRTVWQRMPVLPGVFGRMLIRSQAPASLRKFTASPKATPAFSDIASDIVKRFAEQQLQAAAWVATLNDQAAASAIMTSPFISVITYSVLDGCRLIVAHDRRHFEQARRVTQSLGFSRS